MIYYKVDLIMQSGNIITAKSKEYPDNVKEIYLNDIISIIKIKKGEYLEPWENIGSETIVNSKFIEAITITKKGTAKNE